MHHSPSSLSTAGVSAEDGCERKWWYDNVERIRDPDLAWSEIEAWTYDRARRLFVGPDGRTCTSRQRSAARGTAVHAVLEEYYEGGDPDWSSYIGRIALSGRAHLPAREECLEIRVEQCLGDDPYPASDGTDPTRTALILDGVRLLGYIDLEVRLDPAGDAARRLGIAEAVRAGNGWYTFDYKSSKDVDRYAITPEKARTDPQGVIYPAAGMIRTGTEARGMRWVYMQTEGRNYAKPVDALVTYEGSKAHLRTLVERGRELQSKTSIDQCPPNTRRCDDFGGCPHHPRAGGKCPVDEPIGRKALMGFKEDYERRRAEKMATQGGTPAADAAPSTPPPADATPTVAPPAKKGFGKKAAPAPEIPPAPEAPPPTVDALVNAASSAVTEAASSAPDPAPPAADPEPKKAPVARAKTAAAPAITNSTTVQTLPSITISFEVRFEGTEQGKVAEVLKDAFSKVLGA